MTQDTVDYYTEEIKNYSTTSSKKAFLTRSKKDVQSYLEDLRWALSTESQMLHGEYVHVGQVWEQEDEIRFIEKLYNKLTK